MSLDDTSGRTDKQWRLLSSVKDELFFLLRDKLFRPKIPGGQWSEMICIDEIVFAIQQTKRRQPRYAWKKGKCLLIEFLPLIWNKTEKKNVSDSCRPSKCPNQRLHGRSSNLEHVLCEWSQLTVHRGHGNLKPSSKLRSVCATKCCQVWLKASDNNRGKTGHWTSSDQNHPKRIPREFVGRFVVARND